MRSRFRPAAAALALVVAVACQPLERPFQPESKISTPDSLVATGPRSGIFVGPIEGAPAETARRLARLVAASLRDRDIPATAERTGARAYVLWAEARVARISEAEEMLTLRWRLVDPFGRELGTFDQARQIKTAGWRAGELGLLAFLAEQAAPRIDSLIARPAAARASVPLAPVFVAPVDGAPGDGRAVLTAAMRRKLALLQVPVTDEMGEDTYLVLGAVYVGDDGAGGLSVEILWTLMAPDGTEAGVVSQRNSVGTAAPESVWADIAPAVAEGAAAGIIEILRAVGPLARPADGD